MEINTWVVTSDNRLREWVDLTKQDGVVASVREALLYPADAGK